MRHTGKVDSAEVQGEGSYVVLRSMTRGERKSIDAARDLSNSAPDDKALEQALMEAGDRVLIACILSWNWKDAEGNDMPLPQEPADVDALTDREYGLLARVIWDVSYPSADEKNA